MSWQASAWALKARVGDPVLKILLLAIANYADPDGECHPKVETLAFDSEVSARTIQRSLRKLAELGLITITDRFEKNGRQTSSILRIQMEENPSELREGDSLSPTVSVTGRVTSRCRGEGDNKASPSESFERSNERSIELPLSNARESRSVSVANDWPADYENTFWTKYPNKKAKAHAMKALARIAKAGKTRWEDLITGLDRYILSREVQRGFVKHPATWLNAECWKDQEQNTPLPVDRPQSFFEVAAEAYGNANAARTDQSGEW